MPIYQVKNQWGGSSAPWHEAGRWTFGDRPEHNVVAINVKSDDDGETLNGTMTYKGEGPIGFRASHYIINRLRSIVYHIVADNRHEKRGVKYQEPTG